MKASTDRLRTHRFAKFGVVGVLGFIVDVGTLQVLLAVGIPELTGRIPAIAVATVTTWWLNRTLTFAATHEPPGNQIIRYATAKGVGLGVNYGVFSVCVAVFQLPGPIGVAAGSLAAMILNYVSAETLVFNRSAYRETN